MTTVNQFHIKYQNFSDDSATCTPEEINARIDYFFGAWSQLEVK